MWFSGPTTPRVPEVCKDGRGARGLLSLLDLVEMSEARHSREGRERLLPIGQEGLSDPGPTPGSQASISEMVLGCFREETRKSYSQERSQGFTARGLSPCGGGGIAPGTRISGLRASDSH